MKKWITGFCVTALTLMLATGCNNSSSSTSNNASKKSGTTSSSKKPAHITLTIGDWPTKTDPTYKQYEQWKKEYEQKYPNVTIKESPLSYWTGGSNGSSFYTAAAAGQLPNLNSAPFTETSRVVGNGYAADITNSLKNEGWLKYINPTAAKSVTQNGKYYGIPVAIQPEGLWINVAVFKKAGLVNKKGLPEVPQTWAEVEKDAKIIHQKTGVAGWVMPSEKNMGGWFFLQMAYTYGEQFEKKTNGKWKATFNDQPAVQALTWLKNLKWKDNAVQSKSLADFNYVLQAMGTNQAGMMFGSPDWTNILIKQYHANRNNYAVALMPESQSYGKRVEEVGGIWDFFSKSSSPDQIKAGINWLTMTGVTPFVKSDAVKGFTQGVLSNVKLKYPVGPSDPSQWTSKAPMLKKEQSIVKKHINVNMGLYQDWENHSLKYMKAEPPIDTQQMYAALDQVVQKVLSDKNADPKALLDNAAKNFQKDYLDKYNAKQ